MKNVQLVISTLNEEKSIEKLLQELEEINYKLQPDYKLEIIVIDDDSDDNTVSKINKFKQKIKFPIKLIQRKERGLASAVVRGFKESNAELIGVMDADLSHPPELLIEMIKKVKDFELVIGSRNIKGGKVEDWPFFRKIGSLFCSKLTFLLNVKVKDPLSGFFILQHNVINDIEFNPIGYKILLEVLVKGDYKNLLEIPYTFQNRQVGKSKMNAKVTVDYFRHLLRLAKWKIFNQRH